MTKLPFDPERLAEYLATPAEKRERIRFSPMALAMRAKLGKRYTFLVVDDCRTPVILRDSDGVEYEWAPSPTAQRKLSDAFHAAEFLKPGAFDDATADGAYLVMTVTQSIHRSTDVYELSFQKEPPEGWPETKA